VQGTDGQGNQTQTTAQSGEFWLVHKSGSSIKLNGNANVTVTAADTLALHGQSITLN